MRSQMLFIPICLLSCLGLSEIRTVALDGSEDYTSIQAAVNASAPGDTILVRPGIYLENIEFNGTDLIVVSENPSDWETVKQTVIKAKISQPVVTFSGMETSACRLEGFTIQDGFSVEHGGGIRGNATQAVIRYCLITNNTAQAAGGGLHFCHGVVESCRITGNSAAIGGAAAGCNALFQNCILSDNFAATGGLAFNNCDGIISLCTVVNNKGTGQAAAYRCDGIIENSIFWDNQAVAFLESVKPSCCCYPNAVSGSGNINLDPRFLFPGDYHLRIDSPCIDAGTEAPASPLSDADIFGNVRLLDGDGVGPAIVDMGACEFDPSEPLAVVSRRSVTFTDVIGQSTTHSLDLYVANAGGGQFHWTMEGVPAWLTISPDAGNCAAGHAPNVVTLTADFGGLSSGRYRCDLILNAPQAANPTVTISVELIVVSLDEICVPQIYPTIQDALDAAVDGGRIVVADGVYTGPFNTRLDFCGKRVVLESKNGPDHCIIDCRQQDMGFYFHSGEDENTVLRGFTIRNGYFPGLDNLDLWAPRNLSGGGILVKNSSPSIINCKLIQNGFSASSTIEAGGGLMLYNSAAYVKGCTFSENRAITGGGISIYQDRGMVNGPVIENCILSGNTATNGGGIYSSHQGPAVTQISFCTIVGNRSTIFTGGAGISGTHLQIKNSILWSNGDGSESAQFSLGYNCAINYSCVQGWEGYSEWAGNINQAPKFVQPGYWLYEGMPAKDPYLPPISESEWIEGDYHLQSEGWRWDRQTKRWTYDTVTSPCIDAGNPGDAPGDELPFVPCDPGQIFGASLRVNMGAYGQTDQASLAPPNRLLLTDLTNDGVTDLDDLLIFSSRWLRYDYNVFYKAKGTDFTRDNIVNLADLSCISADWMKKKYVKDPIAHWTFDEDWTDTTGNIPGTPSGGALISHSFTRIGLGAAYFNGIDAFVTMKGFKGVCGQNDRTVCFWMNSTDVESPFISWGSYEDYAKWLIMTEETGNIILRLQKGYVCGDTVLSDGLWHHVAVVLDVDGVGANTANVSLYVDGRRVLTKSNPSPIDTDAFYDVTLGWFEGHKYYRGFIDDLRIYDIALNQWQIADIAEATP